MRSKDNKTIRREVTKDAEVLMEIGAEGKKGDKAAKDYLDSESKKEKELRDIELDILNQKKQKLNYHHFLASLLLQRLAKTDWPKDWSYRVAPTERGIVLELTAPGPRYFRSAFKVTHDPGLDLNAVETFALRAETTLDRENNLTMKQTTDGIYIPK